MLADIVPPATECIDGRSLVFVRLSFASLMIVHSVGRCTDFIAHIRGVNSFTPDTYMLNQPFTISSECCPFVLNYFYDMVLTECPWLDLEMYQLYWHCLHAPLLIVTAVVMLFSCGLTSRLACLSFAWLKMAFVLRGFTLHDSDKYLYAISALTLGILGGHDLHSSLLRRLTEENSFIHRTCFVGLNGYNLYSFTKCLIRHSWRSGYTRNATRMGVNHMFSQRNKTRRDY